METGYFGRTLVRKRRVTNIMAGLAILLVFSIGCGILTVFLSFAWASPISGPNHRKFYIAAEDTIWDYAPVSGKDSGTRYKKAVFREYTDGTFTSRKPGRRPYLGILGPVIKAEVGDELEICVYNAASHEVSLHAHGVLYDKQHEGALYNEGDGAEHGAGDMVRPGNNHTYHWQIPAERGPTASDENCILFAYHSHVTGDTDIHTGLIGPLIICKPGYANEIPNEFVLMFLIFDESQSWYAEENNVTDANTKSDEVVGHNGEEEDSNKFHSVNGYSSKNLRGLQMCVDDDVTWHLMGMGNEEDIHSVSFEGHTLVVNGHRTDVVHLYPGKFVTARMTSHHQGTWPIKSQVINDQSEALMEILTCPNKKGTVTTAVTHSSPRRTRKFYIAAEEKQWNYYPHAPNIDGTSELHRSGKTYLKAMYVQYKDEMFQEVVAQTHSLGFLGPTLRVEVGELLEIRFLNRATRPYSLRSTAFVYADHPNGSEGVLPGRNDTLRFYVGEEFAPTEHDPQCITWRYFSDVDTTKDQYSGLNGVLLTCRQGILDADGNQKYVSTEHVLMLANMDENDSHYSGNDSDESVMESNRIHSINGFTDGTLPKPILCTGGNNIVHVITIGKAEDLHVLNFIGNKLVHHGNHKETIEFLPGSHVTAYVVPSTIGTYPLRSETTKDIRGGMRASYDVVSCPDVIQEVTSGSPKTEDERIKRSYYIAAVEIEWDYAPDKINPITGENLTENEESEIFVRKDATHIGSKYKKVVYREFTDRTFENEKPRSQNELHLGIIGPVIKAEIGDKIHVVFTNKASSGSFNLRPHGVSWLQDPGNGDNTIEDYYNRPVAPGETIEMEWTVPLTAGPTENGFNCSNWMYYSTAKTQKDTSSGLVGPLVVCKPGTINNDGSRNDVDKEFSVLFSVFDENDSWYLQSNVDEYCSKPDEVRFDDDDFVESNKIHAVNGRIYGNLKGLSGKLGDKVAWYLMGLGSEIDLHTAHFHGLSVVEKDDATLSDGRREDVVDLFPGISRTVEMTFDNLGTWLFHCHVDDHLKAGMFAFVNVSLVTY